MHLQTYNEGDYSKKIEQTVNATGNVSKSCESFFQTKTVRQYEVAWPMIAVTFDRILSIVFGMVELIISAEQTDIQLTDCAVPVVL